MSRTAAAIKLRAWQETDLPVLIAMRNDVALQAQLLATARGSDEDAVRAWLAGRTGGTGRIFRVIAEALTDEPVGYLQAELPGEQPDEWRFGICLIERRQGEGRGTAALLALERELARDFGARRLTLEVDSTNERAIRCYRRLGYAGYGAPARQVIVCDQPRQVIAMAKPVTPGEARA